MKTNIVTEKTMRSHLPMLK